MSKQLRRVLLSWLAPLAIVSSEEEELSCGIWFAKSTIPGAGLGIFAGIDFQPQTSVLPTGDVVIPIVDMEIHHPEAYEFLWDEYTWDGGPLFMGNEGFADELNAASAGFGAGVNCIMDLVNVEELTPVNTNAGLHRSQDPGAGGFSTYWNRESIATVPISAGDELFASCKSHRMCGESSVVSAFHRCSSSACRRSCLELFALYTMIQMARPGSLLETNILDQFRLLETYKRPKL